MMRSLRGSILGAGLILLSACGGAEEATEEEAAPPAEFFSAPKTDRAKLFLSQVLGH